MIDPAAIAAARVEAQRAEAEARALADELVAARETRRALRRDLAVLPQRIAVLQANLSAARERLTAAAAARDAAAARLSAAQADAERADATISTLEAQVADLEETLRELLSEGGGFPGRPRPNAQLAALRAAILRARASIERARQGAGTAAAAVTAASGQATAANAAHATVETEVASILASVDEAQRALDAATGLRDVVEARPGELSAAITEARTHVAAAWQPWSSLIAAAHAEIAAVAGRRDQRDAAVVQATHAAALARRAAESVRRTASPTVVLEATARVEAADRAVADARTELVTAASELDAVRAQLVGAVDADALAALMNADVPLVLLPVRLETRFERRNDVLTLLVRIYPDTAHVDTHEPDLTDDELSWGRQFLAQERAAGDDAEARLAAWRQLAARYGGWRAAWVARAAGAEPTLRAERWSRAAVARVLPDRWIALGYRDGSRRFAVSGRPVSDSLAVGPDPGTIEAAEAGAPLGEAARWLVDFERAVDAGMGMRIPLDEADAAGFDRLLVIGVRATIDSAEAARHVGAMFDAHHYTDGVAIVPPGTPTNNTSAARSGWNVADAGHDTSWRTERGAPLATADDGSDGDRLAAALGAGMGPLAHVRHADGTSIANGRAMRAALWPATWGYMLEHLVGGLSDAALDETRAHVLEHVSDRGPLPAVRMGRQPYGMLPATSLEQWALLDPADVDVEVPPLLRKLVPTWRSVLRSLPRVSPGVAVEDVLAEALAMSPLSVSFAARPLAVPPPDAFVVDRTQAALAAVRALDLDVHPPLARATYFPVVTDLTGPLVTATPSEDSSLPPGQNYIDWLASAGVEQVRSSAPPGGRNTLLFALLRHSLLREYATTARRIARAQGRAADGEGIEPGLGAGTLTPWARLAEPLEPVTAPGQTLGQHLDALRAAGTAGSSPAAAHVAALLDMQASLRRLGRLPSAELARLVAGALDVTSHRLDAWIVAHASRRLSLLRASRPSGACLGGYGVLEDVRPATTDDVVSQGFVHAPSLGQAATAAVLRSGYLAHQREQDSPLAIDLSSRRVRVGLALLDGVRAGQPLGALLGYRFERGLHENHPGLSLDRFVAPLRALAPLDPLTEAQHVLGVARARETAVEDQLGRLQAQLAAARDADRVAKEQTRASLAQAQSELDAATTAAAAATDRLRAEQDALQAMLDDIGDLGPGRIPFAKPRDDDFPGAGIPPAMRARIAAQSRKVKEASQSLDAANGRAGAAAARVGDLTARLATTPPEIAALEQAITELQPELEAARAAVADARARVEALRGQVPEVAEVVRANSVVDGLGLRRRWRIGRANARWDVTTIPFGDATSGLPALGSPEQGAIDGELGAVDDAIDALGDLMLAESVHQIVHGNPTRAGATVDALSRGEVPPPDVEFVRTPRAGVGVTHRLLVVCGPGARGEGWPIDARAVRARVEPALEAWVGRVLGPASRVRVRGRFAWPGGEAVEESGLDALGLSALDVLAMAPVDGASGGSPLERGALAHIAQNRPHGAPAGAVATLLGSRDPSWSDGMLGLDELVELARAVRDLVQGARAIEPRDLSLPGEAPPGGGSDTDLASRATIAVQALDAAASALTEAVQDARPEVVDAALGGAERLGVYGVDARAVLAELHRRSGAVSRADGDRARIAAVLGDDFRVLPRTALDAELAASFARSTALQDGDPLAAVTWLQRVAHVRDGASRLEQAFMYADALASPERLTLRVAQLPHRSDDRWAALPGPVEGGRVSFVVQSSVIPAGGDAICGLIVDEWTEVVPERTQVTGLGFHLDQPNSRAPQAILLAVPPTEAHVWSLAALEAVVLETLDLSRLRLVDSEALARTDPVALTLAPRPGHFLPAAYLAASPSDATVTTDLSRVGGEEPA